MLKSLLKCATRNGSCCRRFSTTQELSRHFERVCSPDTSFSTKAHDLKVLLQNEFYQKARSENLQDAVKSFTMAFHRNEDAEIDTDMATTLEAFRQRCLTEATGRALETAVFLNRLASDKKKENLANNATLKKIKERLDTTDLDTLAREIETLDTFISFAIEVKRSEIADLVFEKANDIYNNSFKSLSLRGQVSLASIISQQSDNELTEKAFLILSNVFADLREAGPSEFIRIIKDLEELISNQFETEIPNIENAARALIRQSNSPVEQFGIFSAVSAFASESLWKEVLPIFTNSLELIDVHSCCDLLYLCSTKKYATENLLDALYIKIGNQVTSLTSLDKLKVFFSNKFYDYDTDFVDFEKLHSDIFTQGFISRLSIEDLVFFGQNIRQLESLPDQDRELVLNFINQLANAENPEIKALIKASFNLQQD